MFCMLFRQKVSTNLAVTMTCWVSVSYSKNKSKICLKETIVIISSDPLLKKGMTDSFGYPFKVCMIISDK